MAAQAMHALIRINAPLSDEQRSMTSDALHASKSKNVARVAERSHWVFAPIHFPGGRSEYHGGGFFIFFNRPAGFAKYSRSDHVDSQLGA